MTSRLNRRSVLLFGLVETAIVTVVVLYWLKIWYPDNYFHLFGVNYKLLGLLATLTVLGPVLGVFLYKPDNEGYANDLSVIFVVRLCVLFLALQLAYSQRPLLIVFSVDRFVVVQAHHVSLENASPEIVNMMIVSEVPAMVAARTLPEDDLSQILEVMSGGIDIEYRPAQYERFEYQRKRFFQRFCPSDWDYDKTEYDRTCELIKVPLVYKEDHYATAAFDGGDLKIDSIILSDPW
ncbi:MAG: hypothetical protein RIK85_01905 [Marinobacter sp.]